ncbi:putative major pilin subunit [Limihaloglobus sulfuriphilus]|uniref:Putative major pilin subunit n=1 Tax=Limihaloglobus sulfuriphilus TaxID=1851148 RepID=A0A1Q2MEI4_9BACT|nr:type II secretion system protein [Limihaloglobus sulfuriphilus]AQQ71116.1 putative major pilin subunit [Limihaloglobus sulfuriphilus]
MLNFKKGFTLIELLVVISIIALLMAIMMPALSKAREQAIKTTCMSYFKQIGLSQGLYAAEFQSWLPRAKTVPELEKYGYNNEKGGVVAWLNVMLKEPFEYVRDSYGIEDKFWFCPGLQRHERPFYKDRISGMKNGRITYSQGNGTWPPMYWSLGVSYLIKADTRVPQNFLYKSETALSPLKDSSDKILAADLTLISEKNPDRRHPMPFASLIAHRSNDPDRPVKGASRLHSDGSVKWVDYKEMALSIKTGKEGPLEATGNGFVPYGYPKNGDPSLRSFFW